MHTSTHTHTHTHTNRVPDSTVLSSVTSMNLNEVCVSFSVCVCVCVCVCVIHSHTSTPELFFFSVSTQVSGSTLQQEMMSYSFVSWCLGDEAKCHGMNSCMSVCVCVFVWMFTCLCVCVCGGCPGQRCRLGCQSGLLWQQALPWQQRLLATCHVACVRVCVFVC